MSIKKRWLAQGYGQIVTSEIFSNHGIEIVVGMIFTVLATLFYRVIYFGYFHKKTKKWKVGNNMNKDIVGKKE